MMAVFVAFVAANTLSMHTHVLNDGSLVTHSHPYSPCTGHSHSSSSIDSIGSMNISAATFVGVAALTLQCETAVIGSLTSRPATLNVSSPIAETGLRGPPVFECNLI